MHRFCGNCRNPLGADGRCPQCGWTPQGVSHPVVQQASPTPGAMKSEVVIKHRFCGNCGKPMASGLRCQICGWTPQAVSFQPGNVSENKTTKKKASKSVASQKKKKNVLLIVFPIALILTSLIAVFVLNHFGVISLSKRNTGETIKRLSAEKYLSDIGQVVGKTPAKDVDLLTESEAYKVFSDRGFTDVTINVYYDSRGKQVEIKEISSGSKEKHPSYHALYRTPSGVIWSVSLTGDTFYAEPLDFNNSGSWDVPHTISEAKFYWVYDGAENAFFTVELDDNSVVLKRVKRIDAETLNELNAKEIDEL